MFDFARITQLFSGISEQAQQIAPEGLLQSLSELGLDPAQLHEGGVQDLLTQLSELGVDLNAMDLGQIGDMVSRLGDGTPVADLTADLTGAPQG
jgi:hypothetical protein